MKKKKILFLQFREKKTPALLEKRSLLRALEISPSQFEVKNFFREKVKLSKKELLKFDGVIIGGCSEFSFSEKKEKKKLFQKVKRALNYLKILVKENIPFLGVCFGCQVLSYILGEEVKRIKNQEETGSFSIFLTKEGERNLLFSGVPKKFIAQEGHKDSLKKLPQGATLLAKGKKCKIQAFQFRNLYAVQFHPELDLKDVKLKLKEAPEYKKKNMKFKPSPYTPKILRNFYNLIC